MVIPAMRSGKATRCLTHIGKIPDGSLKTFDFAVANPPFSYKSWSNGVNLAEDEFERFEYGTPPDKNGDYAFLLHILKSLKSTGKAAVILPHGVLFRGNAEARIRQNLVRQGLHQRHHRLTAQPVLWHGHSCLHHCH
jgi:type I restriction-modification system DNA methylase subunit